MKKILVLACLTVAAGNLLAQQANYYRAIQQAKRDSAQNAAEQQRIQQAANGPAAPMPAAPAPAPAAPMDPALQATLANVASLQTDFAGLVNVADKPDVTQKAALMNHLTEAAQGAKKASADSVKKLSDDLLLAVTGKKKFTAPQQTRLAQYVHALFNSSHLSPAQQQALLANVKQLLNDGGAALDDTVNVVTDLKAVVTDTM